MLRRQPRFNIAAIINILIATSRIDVLEQRLPFT
jgi:hypothetical protein